MITREHAPPILQSASVHNEEGDLVVRLEVDQEDPALPFGIVTNERQHWLSKAEALGLLEDLTRALQAAPNEED